MRGMISKTGELWLALTLSLAGLMLAMAACGQSATTEDIQGMLQAVEGKEIVIKLSDGTTARITVNSDAVRSQADKLVGDRIDAKVRVSGGKRVLENVKDQAEDQKFTGVIESVGKDTWVIGGRTFKVDAATVLDGGLVKGAAARVEFITLPDGSMLATQIETDAEDEKLTGAISAISATEVVIGGKTIQITPATRLDDGLAPGVTARVEFAAQPDGKLVAVEIETDQDDEHFSGVIESMGQDVVKIGGKSFTINQATKLDDGLAVGVKARVEFVKLADGSMVVTEIETDQQKSRITGAVASVSGTTWVVDGQTFTVNDASRIEDGVRQGDKVEVRFVTLADGTKLVTRIRADRSGSGRGSDARGSDDKGSLKTEPVDDKGSLKNEPGDDKGGLKNKPGDDKGGQPGAVAGTPVPGGAVKPEDLHLSGAIESIGAGIWVIGGQTFKVDAGALLDSGLAVGVNTTVEYIVQPDGSKLAMKIETAISGKNSPETGDDKGGLKNKPGDDKGGQPGAVAGTPVPGGAVKPEDLHLSGAIESIGSGTWVIGGQTFKVDAGTLLDSGLAVGVNITVEYVVLPDGTKLARKIETAISGKNSPEPGDDKGGAVEPGDDKGGSGGGSGGSSGKG